MIHGDCSIIICFRPLISCMVTALWRRLPPGRRRAVWQAAATPPWPVTRPSTASPEPRPPFICSLSSSLTPQQALTLCAGHAAGSEFRVQPKYALASSAATRNNWKKKKLFARYITALNTGNTTEWVSWWFLDNVCFRTFFYIVFGSLRTAPVVSLWQ